MTGIGKTQLDSLAGYVFERLPQIDGSKWVLMYGSKINGVSFKIACRDETSGGLHSVRTIGMTKAEAYDFLDGMRAALDIVEEWR